MRVVSFNPELLISGHGGTILAQGVFSSREIGAPFDCAFGVLRPGMAQEPERVSIAKLYYVRFGEGLLQIEDEERTIREGDVVWIPAGALHTVRNVAGEDFRHFGDLVDSRRARR